MTKHGTGMRAEVGEDLHINMAGIALLVRSAPAMSIIA